MSGPRIVVVGHPNAVTHNQLVYLRMADLGWQVNVLVPNRWVDPYTPEGYAPQPAAGFRGRFARVRIANPGVIQRHVYVTRPTRWLRAIRPDVVFLEQEPYGMPTLQWGTASQRLGLLWGVQGDDNMPRPLPWPARAIRAWTMPRIDFFAARSPAAEGVLRGWGARAPVAVVPHTLPEWTAPPRSADRPFTVGFAGRLVPPKGLDDLLAAVASLPFPARLLVVGDGPERGKVEAADLGLGRLELRAGVRADDMQEAYAEMDVLVLPSRTTPTWAEQFGKVLGEALMCGTPVIGSSSGEIPWVVQTSGGGVTYPEGEPAALAAELVRFHADPELRARLARAGAAGVEEHFSARGAARRLDALVRAAAEARGRPIA